MKLSILSYPFSGLLPTADIRSGLVSSATENESSNMGMQLEPVHYLLEQLRAA